MKIAVAIATVGRPEILAVTIGLLHKQTRLPDLIIVAPAGQADVEGVESSLPMQMVYGPKGSSAQRNTMLDALDGYDVVLFLDDDFLVADDYLSCVEAAFADPGLVLATGKVLADGARGAGLSVESGLATLQTSAAIADGSRDTLAGYGCNMAVRLAPVFANDLRFDVNLPLYAWLEDWDFSAALRKVSQGRIRQFDSMRGVHLGSKRGKQSGLRLGYSQVANPIYLAGKDMLPKKRLYGLVRQNVLANLVRVIAPEPHIDRWGRLRGNALAFWDLARGQCSPKRIESF
jgi:GT2 family glycosyltransferase